MMMRIALLIAIYSFSFTQDAFANRHDNKVKVRTACDIILYNPLLVDSVPIKGAPGLEIIESELNGIEPNLEALLKSHHRAFNEHELIPAVRYAQYIHAVYGETLILIPSYQGRTVPGFDGVILNHSGGPVANFSGKAIPNNDFPTGELAKKARDSISIYSNIEGWLRYAGIITVDEKGSFHLRNEEAGVEWDKQNIPRRTRRWLTKILHILGFTKRGHPSRPARIVIDVTNHTILPDAAQIEVMREWTRSAGGRMIESIIFVNGHDIMEIQK